MPKHRQIAQSVVKKLQDAGFIAYFAGGWVRDFLMKHPSDDIDIATDASVREIEHLFSKTIPVGVAFGIVIVVEQDHQFEVATFRIDRGYVDGRRPIGIDPASPEEDAKRRDFTINGMFYDPISDKIYDYVGGKEDIEKKVIRAIGNPNARFFEDRLRMMRAVRYSTRFNFPIEERTREAIRAHAQDLLPAVAMERVWQEFKKMSRFAHFDTGLILLYELSLLEVIFPKLKEVSLREIKKRVEFIERFPKESPTFAKLLDLFPKDSLDDIFLLAEYLKLSKEETAFAKYYHHAQALFAMPKEWLAKLEKIEWVELYADPHSEICLEMIACKLPHKEEFLQEHKTRRQQLAPHIHRLQTKNPYLRAQHLLDAGIPPGEKIGELLELGMSIAVNEGIEDPHELIKRLKKSSIW